MRVLLAIATLSVACSRSPASPQPYAPSDVREVASVPEGYALGEALTESCSLAPPGNLDDEALRDVDCSYARLSRTLQARAGEQGARYLVDKRCRGSAGSRSRLSCTASLVRPTVNVPLAPAPGTSAGPAPSPAQVRDLDEPRPQDAGRILVSFRVAADGRVLPPRAYDRVDETTHASVGRRTLGEVSARCEPACDSRSLRHALRVTAGRVGAGELSGVTCFEDDGAARCVGTALVPWSS